MPDKAKREKDEPLAYYRWYWRDWRASRTVQRMTISERGIYRELLDECWQRGAIPDDMEKLAEICSCSLPEIAAAWPTIRKCFESIDGLDGIYMTNARLELERTEQDSKRAQLARAGRKGGIAKSRLANAKQMPYSSSIAEQSSSRLSEADASPNRAHLSDEPNTLRDLHGQPLPAMPDPEPVPPSLRAELDRLRVELTGK